MSLKVIGYIAVALVLLGLLVIAVPALLSAKSTLAVGAGVLLFVGIIAGVISWALKQIRKSNISIN
jgi:protein-S-isoprenylcysteine O-methyltransferase Ste14